MDRYQPYFTLSPWRTDIGYYDVHVPDRDVADDRMNPGGVLRDFFIDRQVEVATDRQHHGAYE
jgi:hypothetical protein